MVVGRTFRKSFAPPGRSRGAVQARLATQAVELEEEVLLRCHREEAHGRVQLGAFGTAGQGLVPEYGARFDVDDGLVHRPDVALDHELEQPLPATPRLEARLHGGMLPGLVERGAQLRIGADERVAERRSRPDVNTRQLFVVGVRDACTLAREFVRDAFAQRLELALVEVDLGRLAEEQDQQLTPSGLAPHHQVFDGELVGQQLGHHGGEGAEHALVGLAPVGALDGRKARDVEGHDPEGATVVELLCNSGQQLAKGRDPLPDSALVPSRVLHAPLNRSIHRRR